MNEIVVVMDFSSSSLHMLDFAVKIAKMYKSFITIIWIDNKENRRLIQNKASALNKDLIISHYDRAIYKYNEFISIQQFELRIITGNPYFKLLSLVNNLQINLLLILNKQKKGFINDVFNTNLNIQSNVLCPVIIFPDNYIFDNRINNILIPIDQSIDTRQKLPLSLVLLKSFASRATICSIKLSKDQALITKYAQQAFNYLYKNKAKVESVEMPIKEIESFCEYNKIGLVISMRYNAIDNALSRHTFTQKLIKRQQIPVLSFPNATIERKALGK